MEDLLIFLIIMVPFLLILCLGALIADFVLPHIAPLERWFDSLPDWDEEDV